MSEVLSLFVRVFEKEDMVRKRERERRPPPPMNDEPIEILSSDATLQSWDDDIQVITKKPEQSYPLVRTLIG